jgi:hypothetical protein
VNRSRQPEAALEEKTSSTNRLEKEIINYLVLKADKRSQSSHRQQQHNQHHQTSHSTSRITNKKQHEINQAVLNTRDVQEEYGQERHE